MEHGRGYRRLGEQPNGGEEQREHDVRNATEGIMTAAALPAMNSWLRIGVVSNGSSVPCSRSPTTVYAARVDGMMTEIRSRSRSGRR